MTEMATKIVENTMIFIPEGPLTMEMFTSFIGLVEEAEAKLNRPVNRFLDLRKGHVENIAFADLEPFSRDRKAILERFSGQEIKLAILATEPVAFGLSRMYGMLLEAEHVKIEVFKERSAAAEWLGIDEIHLSFHFEEAKRFESMNDDSQSD